MLSLAFVGGGVAASDMSISIYPNETFSNNTVLSIRANIIPGTDAYLLDRWWFTIGGLTGNMGIATSGNNTLSWSTFGLINGNYSLTGYVNNTAGNRSNSSVSWVYLHDVNILPTSSTTSTSTSTTTSTTLSPPNLSSTTSTTMNTPIGKPNIAIVLTNLQYSSDFIRFRVWANNSGDAVPVKMRYSVYEINTGNLITNSEELASTIVAEYCAIQPCPHVITMNKTGICRDSAMLVATAESSNNEFLTNSTAAVCSTDGIQTPIVPNGSPDIGGMSKESILLIGMVLAAIGLLTYLILTTSR